MAVVTFEANALAQAYVEDTALPWPLLVDRNRALYRAYGMDRASFWQVWGPRSLWPYVVAASRLRLPNLPTDDVKQRGGDVLIDPSGVVRLHHVGETSVDRPSIESLLATICG